MNIVQGGKNTESNSVVCKYLKRSASKKCDHNHYVHPRYDKENCIDYIKGTPVGWRNIIQDDIKEGKQKGNVEYDCYNVPDFTHQQITCKPTSSDSLRDLCRLGIEQTSVSTNTTTAHLRFTHDTVSKQQKNPILHSVAQLFYECSTFCFKSHIP